VKPMRIALSVDGGLASFPGLRRPHTIDCARLAPERAERLRALVSEARFFSAPPPAMPHGADLRSYVVEIDDGAQCRTLTIGEPIADAGLAALVAEIRACVREQGDSRP
jgi:emfourin